VYNFTVFQLVCNLIVYLYYIVFFNTLVCPMFNKDDILSKRTFTGLIFKILHHQHLLHKLYSTGKSLNIISYETGQEVTLWSLSTHHCLHKNPILDPILNQFNQIHNYYYYKAHFLIIPPSITRYPKRSTPLWFSNEISYALFSLFVYRIFYLSHLSSEFSLCLIKHHTMKM
jgi:hypothetical protein